MLKTLVFDFDGVIVDTEVEWYHIYRDWLKQTYDYNLEIKDYLVCVGASSAKLFDFLEEELGKDLKLREFEQQAMQDFIKRTSLLPPMEGVVGFITKAKQRGLNIALATSATKKKPYYHLERLHLLAFFDALSTAELSEHIKPYPDIFLKAAQLVHCAPSQCLAIEDSYNGLVAATRANMPCLIVPNKITEYSDFTGCYRLVSSLNDVDIDELIENF